MTARTFWSDAYQSGDIVLKFLLVALGILVATGCHDPTDVAQLASVTTDGTRFSLGANGTADVPFSIVNPGREPVYLAACGNTVIVAIERWQNDRWMQYDGGACLTVTVNPMAPLALAPGDRFSGTASVSDAGEYRIRAGASTSETTEPEWRATSNSFTVD